MESSAEEDYFTKMCAGKYPLCKRGVLPGMFKNITDAMQCIVLGSTLLHKERCSRICLGTLSKLLCEHLCMVYLCGRYAVNREPLCGVNV